MSKSFLIPLILSRAVVMSQTGPPVVGYGNTLPTPLYVAPGQLLTLIVQNVNSNVKQIVQAPAGVNLPVSLAGISVGYVQVAAATPPILLNPPVPVLEVHPFSTCGDPILQSECSNLAAITVQIPYEAQSCPLRGETELTR
jgi:hypothetical protein